jgi:hypothetical protein
MHINSMQYTYGGAGTRPRLQRTSGLPKTPTVDMSEIEGDIVSRASVLKENQVAFTHAKSDRPILIPRAVNYCLGIFIYDPVSKNLVGMHSTSPPDFTALEIAINRLKSASGANHLDGYIIGGLRPAGREHSSEASAEGVLELFESMGVTAKSVDLYERPSTYFGFDSRVGKAFYITDENLVDSLEGLETKGSKLKHSNGETNDEKPCFYSTVVYEDLNKKARGAVSKF